MHFLESPSVLLLLLHLAFKYESTAHPLDQLLLQDAEERQVA